MQPEQISPPTTIHQKKNALGGKSYYANTYLPPWEKNTEQIAKLLK
jgi:hypothetical protein